MLFEWISGPSLTDMMSPERAFDMGRLATHLLESAPAVVQVDEPPLVADRVLYWRIDNRLPELTSRGALVSEALDRAQLLLDGIWAHPPHAPRLIHGDLTPPNVLVSDKGLVPIDFQDLVWGFDIQDLAISLTSLGRFDDAEALRLQFRKGYEQVRAWPEMDAATLDGLAAARRLHQLNLALTMRRPGLPEYVDRALALITDWMT